MSDDPLRELDAALGGDLPAALRAAALQFGLTETSAARTPQRNRRVGGAPASFHLEARALDFDGPAFNRRRFHEYIKATYPELAENLLESDHVHLAWRGGTTTMGSDALKELDTGLQVTPPEQVVSEKAGVDEATARAFLESPQAEGVGELVFKSATEAQEEPLRLTTEGTTTGPETEFELSQRREPFPLSVNMADLIEPLEKKEITPEQFVAEAHRRVFIQRFGFTDEQYQEFIRAHNINPFIGVEPGTETPVFAEDAIKRGLRGFADYTVAITPEQYRGVLAGRDELRSFGDLALESVREHAAAIVGGGLGGGLAPLVGAGAGLAQLAEGGIPRAGSPSEVLREAQAGIEQAGAEVTREAGEPSIAKSVLAGATATGLQLPFFVAPELAGPGAGLAPFAAIPGLGALREGPDVALEEAGKGLALGLALKGLGAIEAPTAAQGALRRGIGAGLFAGPAAAEGAPREEVIAQGLLGGVLTPGRGETEAPPSIARELAKIQAKQAGIQPGTEVQRAAQERPVEQGGVGERAGVEAGAAVPADQVQIRGEARPGPGGRGRAAEGREVPAETIIEPPAPLPGVREAPEVPRVNKPRPVPRPIRPETPARAAEAEAAPRPETVPEARPPRAPQEPPVLKPGERERALPKTLEEAGFEGGRDRVYTPISNKESLAAADRLITEKGGNEAAAEFLKGQSEPSAEHTAAGMVLIERLGREADAARAANPELATRRDQQTIDLASHMSERLTRMGQGVQAVQTLNLLSPARRLLRNERLAERNLNRSLTVEEARVTRENAAITERTNGRIAELERQVQELLAGKERKRPEGRATFRDRLKTEADAALERINKRLEVERGSGGPSTELIIDYAKYGAFKLTEKGITLADWTADLIQRFGEGIRPFLPEIRRRSRELLMDARRDDFLDRATIRPLRATALEEIAAEVREANKAMLVAAREAKRADREAARQQLSEAKQAERAERQEIAAEARERLKEARALQKEVEQASRREFRAEARAVREAERRAKRFDTPIREQAAAVRDKPRAEITLDDMAAVAAEKLLPGERRGGVGGFARVMTDEFGEVFSGLKRADREKVFQRGMAKVRDAQKAGREAAARRAVTGGEEAAFTEPQIQRLLFERAERTRENLAATNELLALEKRLSGGVVRRAVTEIFGIPRSLMSSIDLPLGRQGLFFAINHPVITAREAVPRMLRAQVVGKTKFESIIAEMKTHPDFELFRKSGGEWTEIAGRGMAEEAFPSTIAQRLPHVRLSEQAFVAGMNAQRLFVFSRFAEIGRSHGYTPQTHPEFFQSIARLSNIGTGRGELPRFLRSSADLLNSLAYSPRFLAARIQLLGEAGKTGASLVGLAKMDPVLRRIQVMEFLKFGATIMTVMGVAKALGAEVTDDFDSADFGKIRVGGFRFDVTGGLGNVVRFGLRLGGQIERRVTGKRLFASQNELKLASDFLETKAAPIPATVLNLLRGEDFKGDPITAKTELVRLVSPMIADDFYQAYQALGPSGLIAASPALLGFGLQVYDGPAPRSDAGKLARLMLIEQIPQKRRTPEEKAASDIRRQIVKELRATGGIESKTLSEQIAAGEITARQERELVRSGGETELQTDFRRLNVKDALEVLRVATPEERAALEDLMLDKLGSPAFGQLDPAEADRIEREVFQLLQQQKKAS